MRDFIILHYHVNERTDSPFWRDLRQMPVPETLKRKIQLFAENGSLFREQNDLFLESSWLQVMLGQGIVPKDYHPLANSYSETQLKQMLQTMLAIKRDPLDKLPSHDEFLRRVCAG